MKQTNKMLLVSENRILHAGSKTLSSDKCYVCQYEYLVEMLILTIAKTKHSILEVV